jgi:putative Holliday junction resolvase
MTPDDLAAAMAGLAPRTPVLGLDLGTKTIGVAISDITRAIASPLETIARREKASLFILGMPLNMDGSEGPRAQSTRAFARNLAKLAPIPIAYWDERLSTAVVQRMLIDADVSRARRAQLVDKLAAAYLLQSALDSLKPAA